MISAELLARSVATLPSLPTVAAELLAHLQDRSPSLAVAVAIAERDPALSANALRLANSVAYAGVRRVGDVPSAAQRFGIDGFRELATSRLLAAVVGANAAVLTGYGIGRASFSIHSVAAAGFARELAGLVDPALAPQAHTAGLLHDIGKLVVDSALRAHPRLLESVIHSLRALEEEELETMGVHHAEVGAQLLRHWRLPRAVVEAVAQHHGRSVAVLPSIVGVADALAHHFGYGAGVHKVDLDAVLEDGTLATLQQKRAAVMACAELANSRVKQATQRFAELSSPAAA